MKSRIYSFLVIALVSCNVSFGQSLTKLWETDTLLKVPESVLFDAENKVLYVANIDGTDPWAKDEKGSVGKVSLDGKIVAAEWVKGLSSPKGMGLHKGKLYVADLSDIVVIDLKKGVIEKSIRVEGSEGLNDISIGNDGIIWVSDSKNKKIYKVENEKSSVFSKT